MARRCLGRGLCGVEKGEMLLSTSLTRVCNCSAGKFGERMGGGVRGFSRSFVLRLASRRLWSLQCGGYATGVDSGDHCGPRMFARRKLCVLVAILGKPLTIGRDGTLVEAFGGVGSCVLRGHSLVNRQRVLRLDVRATGGEVRVGGVGSSVVSVRGRVSSITRNLGSIIAGSRLTSVVGDFISSSSSG